MKKVKIVQKFFSKFEANCETAYQRSKAKKDGVMVTVEIVSAYKLYLVNGWFKNNPFKKLGLPMVDCFMVIVHYSANFCSPVALTTLKKKIVKADKTNTTRSSFFIVRSVPTTIDSMGSILTPASTLSNTIVIQYKHLTTCSKGRNKMTLAIHPLNMQYRIAA
jgi:hypothetical protein